MVGWHHQLNGHKFEQTPGDGEGQGSLACSVHGVERVRCDLVTERQKKKKKQARRKQKTSVERST